MFVKDKIKVIDERKIKTSFFCKMCGYPLIQMIDFEKNKNYECCNECFLNFIEKDKDRWKSGWRPSKTQIKEYIYLRKQINSKIVKKGN